MRRSRRYSTVLTFAVAATVPISLLVGSAVGPEPARAETAAEASAETSAVADAQWAPDEASAQTIAQQYGHPVAVDSEASPTQLVSALPDGSMQMESDAVPQRVKQGTSWVPVDTTLQVDSDGMFAPKASAAPVEFSVGARI